MTHIRTQFSPAVHGFRFGNRFEFPFLEQFNLLVVRPIPLGELVYGLCGGMCFASLDYFLAGKAVPDFTQVDDINLRLFRFLWERQVDSLRFATMQELFRCMMADDRLIKRMTQDNLNQVRMQIDQGQPAVLGLVRTRGFMNPTRNHQVMATGYDEDLPHQRMTLFLYDPNHPGREPALNISLTPTGRISRVEQSTGEPLRGFFEIKYECRAAP